jgi:hypothetical protein
LTSANSAAFLETHGIRVLGLYDQLAWSPVVISAGSSKPVKQLMVAQAEAISDKSEQELLSALDSGSIQTLDQAEQQFGRFTAAKLELAAAGTTPGAVVARRLLAELEP